MKVYPEDKLTKATTNSRKRLGLRRSTWSELLKEEEKEKGTLEMFDIFCFLIAFLMPSLGPVSIELTHHVTVFISTPKIFLSSLSSFFSHNKTEVDFILKHSKHSKRSDLQLPVLHIVGCDDLLSPYELSS